MRKTTIITIATLLLLSIGGFLFIVQPFNSNRTLLRELSTSFVEDLQFKDFRRSSLYHHKLEQDRVDIGKALERLFLVKPELLNIIDYRIVKVDVDSTSNRARVLINTRFKRLNYDDEPKESDLMLYWIKRHPDCPLGGTCPDERCVDESGKLIYKPDEDDKKKADNRGRTAQEVSDKVVEKGEETYACAKEAEHQWFMNLDSTLKERSYQ